MPHEMHWIVEKRVIYTRFHGVISTEELATFIDQVRAEIQKGTPMVHHISDSLLLERVEFTLRTARAMVPALKMTQELGWQIDINENRLNRMFAGIISQFAGVRTRTFQTLPDAIEFLKHNDETLRDAVWNVPDDKTIPFRSDNHA